MNDILYNRSEAVAALNRVEGFNPFELARTISGENQEEQLYLDVKFRKLWFRLVHPAGKIVSFIRSFSEQMALVEARIYLDKCDPEDSYIANSFSQKFRTDDPTFGDKFLEMAETAAVGRALADAGFGLQFADVGEPNDPGQVDAGIPAAAVGQEIPVPAASATQTGMMTQFYQQAQASGSMVGMSAGQPSMAAAPGTVTNQTGMQGVPPLGTAAPLDPSMTAEELTQRMSYEQAVQVVIPGKGKFGGKTIGQVAVESPQSLAWFANSYNGSRLVAAAANVVINKALPMAG